MAIYFIRGGNYIKIGYADDPHKRLKDLQTGNPQSLELVGFVDGDMSMEKRVHRLFADFRVRGEWFELTTDILAYAQSGNGKSTVKEWTEADPDSAGWIEFPKKGTKNPKYYAKRRNWFQDAAGVWKKTTGVRVKEIPPMTKSEVIAWKIKNIGRVK